jgi:hypothetical protein
MVVGCDPIDWHMPAARNAAVVRGRCHPVSDARDRSDLRVTDELLADAERLLGRLHAEFGAIAAHRDELRHVWGADDVAGAMGAFVDNWSWYRKKLLGRIESVGTLVGSARETFHATDRRLAKAG